ncbi:MAG: prepilin-type N-terminal cleavage/methylation domain-containing protein [Deltaproteobacteria bacterium]|nr:prepilin-type N-terminal cleavage/methylation domain-containing protein [Deltaproteobacteria bacterium]
MKRTSGFTLIEILIAVFILSVVISTVYAAYTGTFRIIRDSEYNGEIYSMARITLERMTKDMEAVSLYGGNIEFISRPSDAGGWNTLEITFRSRAHINFEDITAIGGMTTIRYRVAEGEERNVYTLLRDDDPTPQANISDIPKAGFVVCEQIRSLEYRFYDDKGSEYDSWNSLSGPEAQKGKAPAAVSVSLSLMNPDDEDKPYTFVTRVYIPVNQPLKQGAS